MRVLKGILIIFLLLSQQEGYCQSNDLDSFLLKFKLFAATHYSAISWSMPFVKNSERNFSSMPNVIAIKNVYMVDPETGLRIYPQLNKVYDPETGYSADYESNKKYTVDLEARKIYTFKTEVEILKHQKTN